VTFNLDKLVRDNIKRLVPYSSARHEFEGRARVFLDANESTLVSRFGTGLNRYPDPQQKEIKRRLGRILEIDGSQIFVGNGSDEAIDLLFRVFCRPGRDNVVICPPTYGVYEVAADVNDIAVRRVNLTDSFDLDLKAIRSAINDTTKLIFLCSPNNPTGNLVNRDAIIDILDFFAGIVVVDEAYIHFANERSLASEIDSFPNLVVLQTFSKAWGLAGLRVGFAIANRSITDLLCKTKPPYNVSNLAQEIVLDALRHPALMEHCVERTIAERNFLAQELTNFPFVTKVFPSDANFLLVRMTDAAKVHAFLLGDGIVVRNRSDAVGCESCLRITVGTSEENRALLYALSRYETSPIY